MQNCIFSGHCCKSICDKSCPTLAETTYLLERNNIEMNNKVFHASKETIDKCCHVLDVAEGTLGSVIDTNSTVEMADLLTYCGICKYWKGSRLHCSVYNLKYAKYIDMIQKSWNTKSEPSELEFMRIWASTAKLLIISNIDYVNFRDFQCQTLLTLLQDRASSDLTTIIVSPKVQELVGDNGTFFHRLTSIISKAVIKYDNKH